MRTAQDTIRSRQRRPGAARLCPGLALALLLAGAALPCRAEDVAPGGANSDFCIVAKATVLPTAQITATDARRVKPFLDALPEGYRARVEFTTFGAGGDDRTIRYVCLLTPLDPKDRIDGTELAFGDWYRKPVRITPFRQGVKHGSETLFQNGGDTPQAEIPWEDGRIHGVKKTFHANGQLASESTYEKDVVTGTVRTYAPDGQLIRVARFVKGERDGDMIDYWPGRGEVVERIVPYRKGVVDGLSKAFYANGALKWERPFRRNDLHGIERHFTVDGQVEKERYWLKGQAVGAEEFRRQFKE